MGPGESNMTATADRRDQRRQQDERNRREQHIENALEEQSRSPGSRPRCSGMVGNWPMYSIGTIPGQAVVKLGHYPDIDTRFPRLGHDARDHAGVTGRGEKNLVREKLPGQLQHLIDGAEDIAGQSRVVGIDSRDMHVTPEAVSQVSNAIQVVAHRLADPAGPNNNDVAGFQAPLEAAVHHHSPYQPAGAEQDRRDHHREDHYAAGDHFSADQVQCTGQKQPCRHAGLDGEPLFVQSIAHLHRAIQVITLADQNERKQ